MSMRLTGADNVICFGAGASFGSDSEFIRHRGMLPPLGKDLFTELEKYPRAKHWHSIPNHFKDYFRKNTFEAAMRILGEDEEQRNFQFRRDLELSLYFSQFRPEPSNLYWKLARKIARKQELKGWSGAIITLNYERLLEESFLRNLVFPDVQGITFYDDQLPKLLPHQRLELCYPHGACHFFFDKSFISGKGNVVFGNEARLLGDKGANHLLIHANIEKACEMECIPIICRYEPSKHPSINNYFTDTQQSRCAELISEAKNISIVGVQCSHENDNHIWKPLGKTTAKIFYFEPFDDSISTFRTWAASYSKREGLDYAIVKATFKERLDELYSRMGL